MERDFFNLTPKRKSILWDYQNNGNARIVAVKPDKMRELDDLFNEAIPNLKICEDDGVGVILNHTGTKIWENCDGLTTIEEILGILSEEYCVEKNGLVNDVDEFLKHCEKINIIDVNWRSME